MTTTPDDVPAIRVHWLVKTYGENRAVDGVDLTVRCGQIFALLGPNGAGKSTTVEILEGYRSRDGGTVRVLDTDPAAGSRDARWRARIGVVLQSATDAGELTVRETVHHFAKYYAQPRDPDETIALVGLADQARGRVRQLSGGQRRRLDVALGILGDPELIFLDEPTTGFDPEARRRFWELIRLLADEGCTTLLTTHYLDEAEALADRVAVINRGRIIAEGTPADLGDRGRGESTVRWRDGVRHTATPTELVRELAVHYGGEVPDLTVNRPSLEDVYLELVS